VVDGLRGEVGVRHLGEKLRQRACNGHGDSLPSGTWQWHNPRHPGRSMVMASLSCTKPVGRFEHISTGVARSGGWHPFHTPGTPMPPWSNRPVCVMTWSLPPPSPSAPASARQATFAGPPPETPPQAKIPTPTSRSSRMQPYCRMFPSQLFKAL
jgi:hypothetical protein